MEETHLPKLLSCIFTSNPLQNLSTAGMLIDKVGNIIHAIVDDDVETALCGFVVGHFGGSKLLVRHPELGRERGVFLLFVG